MLQLSIVLIPSLNMTKRSRLTLWCLVYTHIYLNKPVTFIYNFAKLINSLKFAYLINRQNCQHIETSQLICSANQLTGFYIMATLALNELILETRFRDGHLETRKFMTNWSRYSRMGQVKFLEDSL